MYVRLLILSVAVLMSRLIFGQPDSFRSFDVASVKLSQPGPRGWLPRRMTVEPGGQRFTATNANVKSLIGMAYNLKSSQVSGGPEWLTSVGFDIEAKTSVPTSRSRMGLMLQALLSERFALTLRRELRELPVAAS